MVLWPIREILLSSFHSIPSATTRDSDLSMTVSPSLDGGLSRRSPLVIGTPGPIVVDAQGQAALAGQGPGADRGRSEPGPDGVPHLLGVLPRRPGDVIEGKLPAPALDQSADADPDQPDARRGVDRSQQLLGRAHDGRARVGGPGERGRPGDGAEVVEAHLQGHGPSGAAGGPQPRADRVPEADELPLERAMGAVVAREGLLVADRLRLALRLDRPIVDAV